MERTREQEGEKFQQFEKLSTCYNKSSHVAALLADGDHTGVWTLNRIKLHYKRNSAWRQTIQRNTESTTSRRDRGSRADWHEITHDVALGPGDLWLNVRHDGHILKSPACHHISDTTEGSSARLNLLHEFGSRVEASARPHRRLLLVRPLLRWESGGTRHEAAELWTLSGWRGGNTWWTESGSPLSYLVSWTTGRRAEHVTTESPENYMYLTNHSHIYQP